MSATCPHDWRYPGWARVRQCLRCNLVEALAPEHVAVKDIAGDVEQAMRNLCAVGDWCVASGLGYENHRVAEAAARVTAAETRVLLAKSNESRPYTTIDADTGTIVTTWPGMR